MNEYRRARRRDVPQVVKVLDTMTEQVIGRIGNISETGMLLIGHDGGHDDALYQLRFQLQLGPGVMHTLDVGVHQLWSDLTLPPSTYWTGFRFIDIDSSDAERLRAWIDHPDAKHV